MSTDVTESNEICEEIHENGSVEEFETVETCSANTNSISKETENLKHIESELQKRYQVDVIRSFDFATLPPAKPYPIAQKELAAKLYELCNESHFLSLKYKHEEELYKNAVQCVQRKWILRVDPVELKDNSDDITHELKLWSLQMKSYEDNVKHLFKINPELAKMVLYGGQWCMDSCYTFEAYQEKLEFSTENRNFRFKITLRYFDDEITVDCSLYLEGLRKIVQKCFSEKCSIDELIQAIWSLANSQLINAD